MVTVENRDTSIVVGGDGEEAKAVTYMDLIKVCISVQPEGGWDKDSMRKVIKIEDHIDKHEGSEAVEFEDSYMSLIKTKVNAMKWAQKHKDLVTFVDYIDSTN